MRDKAKVIVPAGTFYEIIRRAKWADAVQRNNKPQPIFEGYDPRSFEERLNEQAATNYFNRLYNANP